MPVKLKNNIFTRCMNTVTEMYSLPAYDGVDPNAEDGQGRAAQDDPPGDLAEEGVDEVAVLDLLDHASPPTTAWTPIP